MAQPMTVDNLIFLVRRKALHAADLTESTAELKAALRDVKPGTYEGGAGEVLIVTATRYPGNTFIKSARVVRPERELALEGDSAS